MAGRGFHSDADRRKAMKRPPLTLAEAQLIREQVHSVDIVGSEIWDFGFRAEYHGESTNPNLSICGGRPSTRPTTRTTSAWGGTSRTWTS